MQNKVSDFSKRTEYIVDTFYKGNKTAFAKDVGITRQMVNKWERQDKGEAKGNPNPSLDTILNIVSKTGVNPTWLVTGEGDPSPDHPELDLVAERYTRYENAISGLRKSDISPDEKIEFLREQLEVLLGFLRND